MNGYGEAILINTNDYGMAPTVYLVSGVITMTVLFDHYDGIQLA